MYVKSAEWRKSFAESKKSEFENITKIPKLEQKLYIEVFNWLTPLTLLRKNKVAQNVSLAWMRLRADLLLQRKKANIVSRLSSIDFSVSGDSGLVTRGSVVGGNRASV